MSDTVSLHTTYTELITNLGTPLSATETAGLRTVTYVSDAPILSDIYIFDHDDLVYLSHSFYSRPKELQSYISQYGLPGYSVAKYPANTHDSLMTYMHVWPDAGRAVTTIGGSGGDVQVIREDQFAPVGLNEYLAKWGTALTGHSVATVSALPPVTPQVSYIPTSGLQGKSSFAGDAILLGGLLVLIAVVVLVMRKLFKHKETPANQ